MKSVVLCADETSLRHPEHIGLEGESLFAQPWLRTFSEAQAARDALARAQEVAEVWVVSNDEVEPINLAAAIKSDRSDRQVYLVAFAASGSLKSRVETASLDGILSRTGFVRRYMEYKSADARNALSPVPSGRAVTPANSPVSQGAHFGGKVAGTAGKHVAPSANEPNGKHIGVVRLSKAQTDVAEVPGVYQPPARYGSSHRADIMEQAMMVVQDRVPETSPRDLQATITSVQNGTPTAMGASLPQPVLAAQSRASQAFLLPVLSGSGGSGKSTVAVLSALVAHRAGLRTLLVDLDVQFGDMQETLGYEDATSVDELLDAPGRVKLLKDDDRGPALLCAPRKIEQAEDIFAQLPTLLDLVVPHFDLVVVNTGSFWTEIQAVLLERCSKALFIVDQRPSSLRACQRALDLCTRCGIAASPLVFAVNKCSKQSLYSSIDVSCALNGATAKELSWGGTQVEEMLAAGQAAALLDTRNALVESLAALLRELIPQMPEVNLEGAAVARMSFLRMLMGRNREEQPCR